MDYNFLDDEFFILESSNLDSVKNEFFGYTIQNDIIVRKDTFKQNRELNGTGAYICINSGEDDISIFQDHMGCFGLYQYTDGEYFAISNSFLKLIEFLSKSTHPITLNKEFADYYLSCGLTPLIPHQTLINEIEILPRNCTVHISKKQKTISLETFILEENSIPIDSEEGIDILDEWYYRWTELFRNLRKKTNDMIFDLSGGLDSRIVSALWLSANINHENVRINSSNEKKFKEDFEIASEISEHFGIELNLNKTYKRHPHSIVDSINASQYLQLGLHAHRYWKVFNFEMPVYRIKGHCGEPIRYYPHCTFKEYKQKILKRSKTYNNLNIYNSTKELAYETFDEYTSRFNESENSRRLPSLLYRDTRNRYHFGLEWIESLFENTITLAPLSDYQLSKLKPDSDKCMDELLLYAIIFLRYCPDLLDFRIQGNRKINENTIQYAKKINEKYPFVKQEFDFISGPEPDADLKDESGINQIEKINEINVIFKNIFFSKQFVKEFEKYYPKDIYRKIKKDLKNDERFQLEEFYAAMDIIQTVEYVNLNRNLNTPTVGDLLASYECRDCTEEVHIEELLEKYHTLRADIKNIGQDNNDIEILKISDDSKATTPNWFGKTNGIGHVIKTTNPSFNMELKIINDGLLKLRFRGLDVKDKNKNRFPVYVDCKKISINSEIILTENTLVSHEDYYEYTKEVKDGDIITIEVEWLPFNKSSVYEPKKAYPKKENDIIETTDTPKITKTSTLKKKIKRIW